MSELICAVTRKPCGTGNWMNGAECYCANCFRSRSTPPVSSDSEPRMTPEEQRAFNDERRPRSRKLIPVPPVSSSVPEIEKMLDEFNRAALAKANWIHGEGTDADLKRLMAEKRAARSALLSEYARMRSELDRAVEGWTGASAALCDESVVREENARLRSRLASLESQTLTRDEALFLYGIPIAHGCTPEVEAKRDEIIERFLNVRSASPQPETPE